MKLQFPLLWVACQNFLYSLLLFMDILVLWEKHALMTMQPHLGHYVPYFSL